MAKYPNEDLFADTTMTFGEHLEELRIALFKAIIGLVVGVLIGMFLGDYVVRLIERPLMNALTAFGSESAKLQLRSLYPGSVSKDVERFVGDNGLIFEEVRVERSEIIRLARELNGDLGSKAAGVEKKVDGNSQDKLPPPSAEMLKTRIWRPVQARITSLSPHETFMIWFKSCCVAGLVVASPYVFYQIWAFVAAGLYPHEKRYVHIFLPFSIGLFLAGVATAYFLVFGPVLSFLFGFGRALNIDPDLRISEVVSFVLILPLGFGISFQLPLVMFFLNRIGILSVEAYLSKWRISILSIFVIAMVLTPADPISMLLMAVPLTVLFFVGVGLCKWMPRQRSPFDEAYEP